MCEVSDNGRRSSNRATRKKHKDMDEPPDHSVMTMQELIYYNPSANPMSSSSRDSSSKAVSSSSSSTTTSLKDSNNSNNTRPHPSPRPSPTEGRLVPQLMIGADGNIQVDERSIYVETTKATLSEDTHEVNEDEELTTSTSFRQMYKIKKWSKEETSTFYKALSQVGTDFTMMTLLIPSRSRKELKNKFKKEEKSNPTRISSALHKLCVGGQPLQSSQLVTSEH